MKRILQAVVAAMLLLTFNHLSSTAFAQGTVFTYQGQLQSNGSLAGGTYNLQFLLYTNATGGTAVAGPVTDTAVTVTNGLFTVTIDFGAGVWNGETNWLQIAVETNNAASFTTLTPRQQLTPVPYAIFAETASNLTGIISSSQINGSLTSGQLSGNYLNMVTISNAADVFSGSFTGNGAGLSGVWLLNGNSGTTPGPNYLGTADNNPLELHVNGTRALRLEPGGGVPNIIGGAANNAMLSSPFGGVIAGGSGNSISNSQYAVIGGGTQNFLAGNNSVLAGGNGNTLMANQSVLSGGYLNTIANTNIGMSPDNSFIGGGFQNNIQAEYSTIAGGEGNAIVPGASDSFIGGGDGNIIQTNAYFSVIDGGVNNLIVGSYSTIVGGNDNLVSTNSYDSAILGGSANQVQVSAPGSFIGGGDGNQIQSVAGVSAIAGGQLNQIQYLAEASFIGGGSENTIGTNAYNSSIVGGNDNAIQLDANYSFIGGGIQDTIQNNANNSAIVGGQVNVIQQSSYFSFIGGGNQDQIQSNANNSVISGGGNNTIQVGDNYSTIGGGYNNSLQLNAYDSMIGGGYGNQIQSNSTYAVIAGGQLNTIQPGSIDSVIGGGNGNQILTNGSYGVVPGGQANVASANAFAAGTYAQATNSGSFVWADDSQPGLPFTSTTNNQFNVHAVGGVRFVTGGTGMTLDGQPIVAGAVSLGQLPAAVLTNNETASVTLDNSLSVGGTLNFSALPVTIDYDGSLLMRADQNDNFFAGLQAGNLTTTGGNNTAIGYQSFQSNASGHDNTANGYQALYSNASGFNNTAFSEYSLYSNTGGSDNTAIGPAALYNNISGVDNIALGFQAGYEIVGSSNIDIGNLGTFSDVNTIRIGSSQTATYLVGTLNLSALPVTINSGGNLLLYADNNENFFAGTQAGNPTTTSGDNTAIGFFALYYNTSGSLNTANGVNALINNTSGSDNTASGARALDSNSTGNDDTAIGFAALEHNTNDSELVAVGSGALENYKGAGLITPSGSGENTAVGYEALQGDAGGDDSGVENTAVGYQALLDNTFGDQNTANGTYALNENTSGANNTAIGYQALLDNTSGGQNTAAGSSALGFNRIGINNTAYGYEALGGVGEIGGVGGSNNIALGFEAGDALTGIESYNIDIGNQGVTGESGTIRIGDPNYQTATYLVGNVYTPSGTVESSCDRNLKENFTAINPQTVLARVAAMPVSEWNYKTDKNVEHIGPVAQDFHAAFGLNGVDDKHISVVDEGGVALAAIQGLNEKLEADNAELKQENVSLAKRLDELEAQVNALMRNNH